MARKPGNCIGWAALLLWGAGSLCAQTNTASRENSRVEQAIRFRPQTPVETDDSTSTEGLDQAPSSPGDPDLGEQVILRRRDKVTPFKLFADVSGFYTSNAALTNASTVDDFFLVAQVGISYQTRLAPDLFGEVTVRQSAFRYAEFSDLDFDSLDLGGGLTYVAKPLWSLAFSVRYNYNRLTDGSQHDEFFKNQTVTLGVQKTFELSKAHYIYVGYASVLGWGEPVAPQRDEHGIFLGYHASLTRSISADLSYRFALFDYVDGRDDWNQNLSLGLKWEVTRWLNLATSASGGINRSSQEAFDYNVFTGGVSVTATIAF